MSQFFIILLIWIFGLSLGSLIQTETITPFSDFGLYLLMFLVGLQLPLANNLKTLFKNINIEVVLTLGGLLIGSLVSGALIGSFFGFSFWQSILMVSGLGYYSYAASAVATLAQPQLTSLVFLVSLLREQISIVFGRLIARYFGHNALIACTATSSDGLLPFIKNYAGHTAVSPALIIATFLNIGVPILISFILKFV